MTAQSFVTPHLAGVFFTIAERHERVTTGGSAKALARRSLGKSAQASEPVGGDPGFNTMT